MADDGIKLSPTVLIVSIYFKGICNVRPSINDHLYRIFDREFNPLLRLVCQIVISRISTLHRISFALITNIGSHQTLSRLFFVRFHPLLLLILVNRSECFLTGASSRRHIIQ